MVKTLPNRSKHVENGCARDDGRAWSLNECRLGSQYCHRFIRMFESLICTAVHGTGKGFLCLGQVRLYVRLICTATQGRQTLCLGFVLSRVRLNVRVTHLHRSTGPLRKRNFNSVVLLSEYLPGCNPDNVEAT